MWWWWCGGVSTCAIVVTPQLGNIHGLGTGAGYSPAVQQDEAFGTLARPGGGKSIACIVRLGTMLAVSLTTRARCRGIMKDAMGMDSGAAFGLGAVPCPTKSPQTAPTLLETVDRPHA